MARALTAFGCALALAGCGGGDAGDEGSPLALQLWGDPDDAELYTEVADAFEAQAGTRVQVTAIADRQDHLAKLTASFAARRAPDVFLVNHRHMAGYAQRGVIEPVGERPDGYVDVALDAFTFDGVLQCLPQNASSLVVYVNRALIAGPAPRDLEELAAVAGRATRGDVHGLGTEASLIRLAPFVWSAGGELVDDEDAPTRFALDTPQARKGFEDFLALARFGPSLTEVESKSLEDRFLAGELAMLLSSRRDVPAFRTIEDFEWDVALLPLPTTVLHSDGWCVSEGADPRAAEFVRFATGTEGQEILAEGGRTVPSLESVARSDAFLGPRPPASNEVFLAALDQMRRLPTTPNWERVEESANLALEQAFYGRLSPDAALERIAAETDGRF